MDLSPLHSDRSRGLLYLEAGPRNIAQKLKLVELSSREVATALHSEAISSRQHSLEARSISPLRSHTKVRLKPVRREKQVLKAEKWLENAAPRDTGAHDSDTYESTRLKIISQFQQLHDCRSSLECNYELLCDTEELHNSPLSHYFRLSPTRAQHPRGKEGKTHCEMQCIDARKMQYRCPCRRCGIIVLCEQPETGFECLYCRFRQQTVIAETCGAVCIETLVEGLRGLTPSRIRLCKDESVDEKPHSVHYILRVLLSDSLLKKETPLERSSWQSLPRSYLQSTESEMFPSTPSFPATSYDQVLKNSIANLRKAAKTINSELSGKMEEQSELRSAGNFHHTVREATASYISDYSRCMRSILRGVLQILPEHAAAMEKCVLGLAHLCELGHQAAALQAAEHSANLDTLKKKVEDTVMLKVRIKALERELILQEVNLNAKVDSLARMNRKYEEMMRLCPSD